MNRAVLGPLNDGFLTAHTIAFILHGQRSPGKLALRLDREDRGDRDARVGRGDRMGGEGDLEDRTDRDRERNAR